MDANKPSIALAGPDPAFTLPTDSLLLDGIPSSDPDGRISVWLWTKISGPAIFSNNASAFAQWIIINLNAGIYKFE